MIRSDLELARRWMAARLKLTLRNPRAVTFTFAFPIVLVVLFNALNGSTRVTAAGARVPFSQFYTPAIGVFSLVAACYTTLILGVATARDQGLLKRVRGTPLPLGTYLGAWMTGAALVGLLGVVAMFVVSVPAFGVHVYARSLPAAAVTLVLGAACLTALGVAVASVVRNADQAMPVAQLTFLPISFISGIWYPLDNAPSWLVHVAHFFPLSHIAHAFERCFVPGSGSAWSGGDLVSIAVWAAVGIFVAARRFRWEGADGRRSPLRLLRARSSRGAGSRPRSPII
jgi:ABC-2 type transport system permease protein